MCLIMAHPLEFRRGAAMLPCAWLVSQKVYFLGLDSTRVSII